MRQIFNMVHKEFLQIFRTREMMAIIFIMPLIQMLILGFAITTEVKHIKLIIADQDRSRISKEIIDAFSHTDRFDIVGYESSIDAVSDAVYRWDAQLALIVPRHFARDIQRNLQPTMQLIVDGLDGNTAGVALGYARGILQQVTQSYLQPSQRLRFVQNTHLVAMQERMWYNLDLNTAQYMVPGIVVVLLTIITMMLASMGLVREKEIGTLEQLMVTPLKKHQLLLGKLIPFLILAFVELAVVLKAAQLIFSITMQGSYLLLGALSFIYLFTTLGLGIFVSTFTGSQQQAMFVSWFFMVFMLLMSGFFIPIENMPLILQKITYLNPMRYFMYIVRDIFQKGSTLQYLWVDVLPLAAFGVLIFFSSILKFQKRVG